MKKIIYIITLLLLILLLFLATIPPKINPLIIHFTITGISFLIFIIPLIFTTKNIICKSLNKFWNDLSQDKTLKLVSLALISLLLPHIPKAFINSLFSFIYISINEVFINFINDGERIQLVCESFDYNNYYYLESLTHFLSSECSSRIFVSTLRLWISSLTIAYNQAQISFLPFVELILFLALLSLTVKIIEQINSLSKSQNWNEKTINWLQEIFKDPIIRSNIIFYIILSCGIYLSIASIATIPSLQTSKSIPGAISVENLQESFDKSVISFRSKFLIQEDGLNSSSKLFDTLKTNSPSKTTEEFIKEKLKKENTNNQNVNFLNSIMESSIIGFRADQRRNLIQMGEQMLSSINAEMNEMVKNAITKYEISSSARKGSRETIEHYLALIDWFNSSSSSMERQFNQCFNSINNFDQNLENEFNSLQEYISYYIDNNIETNYYSPVFENNNNTLDSSWRNASNHCQTLETTEQEVPSRQELGAYLGVFSFVASWLLRIESLPLTLITGLIGFGLLGAACSSFVRERIEPKIEQKKTSLLVKDLPKVIIIGLSAAILVFLSVMGGLAVFFSTNSDPNPYALLLGCLIAASFGEDVWKAARNRFKDNLKKQSGNSQELSKKSKEH